MAPEPRTSAKILLVDDDPSLLDLVAMSFGDAGYEVITAQDGLAAFRLASAGGFDALVSDVNMPGLDGFTLCRRLRAEGSTIPIVLLTSRDAEIDEALGLELGADDYVVKPFRSRILLARVASLLRRDQLRREAPNASPSTIEDRDTRLDVDRLEARHRGEKLELTLSEFRLLEALLRRKGIVLSRDRLLELVRGDDSVVVERIIDTYVRRIRRKFEAIDPSFDRIETVVGAGYRWKDPA